MFRIACLIRALSFAVGLTVAVVIPAQAADFTMKIGFATMNDIQLAAANHSIAGSRPH